MRRELLATITAHVTVGFPFDDEPTVNSQDELTVANPAQSTNPLRLPHPGGE